jgi:hypothetical protein
MTNRETTTAGLSKDRGHDGKSSAAFSIGALRRFADHLCLLSLLAGVTCLCGCLTNPKDLFTANGPGWRVQQGQALWRPERGLPEFGGDLVLASDADGRCLIQFDKTPIAIVSAQVTSSNWLIRFPQRQMGFSGSGPGPTRFGWLYLHSALAGEKLPEVFHFERKADGGWRLENSHTGESLEGFLSP